MGGVDKSQTKEQQDNWQDESEAKADTPKAVTGMFMIRSQDDQDDNTGDNKAQINREVGGNGI